MKKLLSITTSILFIVSCGGGVGGGGTTPTPPTTPAPTVNLSADPISVLLENTSTLTWSSTNATSCSASWTTQTGSSGSEAVTISTAGNNSFSISCTGAGGSSSASVTVEGYRNTDGVVVDGYISGAEVCIDEDESWTCDSSESSTTSDNDGKFTIKYANGNLVSIGGTDLDSQTLLDNLLITHKLTGHSDFKAVTPVTSVAAFMTDASQVNAALGIDSSIDVSIFDPVANKGDGGINDYLYEKGNQLTVLAYALQNITNDLNTTTETTQDYFKAITEEIEKEYTETEIKVDIETEEFITKTLDNIVEAKTVTISDDAKANTTKALSGVMPIIEVKSSDDLTTSVIRFAVSTLQTDIQAIANGTATAEIVASYSTDVLTYIATDQNIDADEITPDINAIADSATTSEDTAVDINVLVNDSFITTAPITVTAVNGANGSIVITANIVSYTPNTDFNGTDTFSYTITQGDKTSSADVSISIEAVNDAPSIDSASTIQVAENQTAVTTISVSDVDEDDLTLTLSGTDADSFDLSTDNVLTFKEAPDFETKSSYSITLTLTDGTETVSKDISVAVTNVNDIAPEFTSEATFSAAENQTAIGSVVATDAEDDEITFTVSGSELAITSAGVLTFVAAPDFETKSTYTATVTATDGTNSTTQAITVNVTDVVENSSPVFTSNSSYTVAENQTSATNITVTDADSDSISFSLSGTDADSFAISSSGALTFNNAPNYETKDSYSLIITASDGTASVSQTVTITISNINEVPQISALSSNQLPDENQLSVVTVSASDPDASTTLTYSLSGTDSSLFAISSSGVITFSSAPDYETPGDADGDNNYQINVVVSDGSLSVTQAITIQVQNVADLISGVAVDGYVAGATVFQDLNNDGDLDSGEPSAATNSLGSFSLNLSSVNINAPVRIINGFDLASNEIHPSIMDISVSETGSYIVTPISTLVGRLKIQDTALSAMVPQSMIAGALGISLADSPNDSILGFDPIAYFNGSDTTLASEARPVFAASQLLMTMGGGNYSIHKYITDQALSVLSSTLTTAAGTSITLSSATDIIGLKQDAYDAIFNGYVDTALANNPPINNIQFKNNKAVMTDYVNGPSSSAVNYSLYGVHDGSTTLVADLDGAKLDYDNLKQILDNDGTGTPMDLNFELANIPAAGSGSTGVILKLFMGADTTQASDEDYLQIALTANWESDGTNFKIKLPASSSITASFFDRSGTTLSITPTNQVEDIFTVTQDGPNRPATLSLRLSKLFNVFPSEVTGLSSFLDAAAEFTYLVEFDNFSIYDHLDNTFTKIQGTFGVNANPGITVFADDIYVHENATSKDISFYLSQAAASDVTLDYAIADASTASSSDYSLSSGTVTIPAGSMSTTLTIPVTNDTTVEAQEEIRLTLSNVQNAVLGRSSVSAFITDGEEILANSAQKAILADNIFKDSKASINAYIKNKLDTSTVTISGTSYTYSQVLVNNSITTDVYAYLDSIIDDYEVMSETLISTIMTKADAYIDSQLSSFASYTGFATGLTQLNSGIKGLDMSQIVGTNINSNGSFPSGQNATTLQTALDGKVDTLVTLAADTVADILGTDTNTNFPNANVVMGTDGDDTITGTSGSDLIASFNGTDTVNGLAGNDKILGGSGVDTLNGGDNDDHIYGYAGNDVLNGNADADKILGGKDNDTINGGAGDDDLRGEAGDDTITSGAGSDTISGGLGDDTIIIDAL